jgi:ferredoxin-NADP reductase
MRVVRWGLCAITPTTVGGDPVVVSAHDFKTSCKEVAMATETVPIISQKSKLMRREEVAEGTMAFHFEKPPGFAFKPGQHADVTLPNPPEDDAEGNTRTFSIGSPPSESELVFTTRMRDTAFKRSLKKMPLGTEVKIGSAAGSFTLHKNLAKAAVFIAGGIGITPFLSIVWQANKDRLPQDLYLFYSNRRPEDAAFLDSLQAWETTNLNFRLICTMTEMSKSKKEWKGETALIDKQMLERHLLLLQGPIYYIAGPPPMVASVRQTLVGAGIEEDEIRSEEFAGY